MVTKGFNTEPPGYEKTAISDLQGSWVNLRDSLNAIAEGEAQ